MASLRATAQKVLEEAREGIAWFAFYRDGRGWGAESFWPDYDPQSGDYSAFEAHDLEIIHEILATDENAIFVNGYDSNLGPIDEMTRDTLAGALRWQYENQFSRLAEIACKAVSAEQKAAAPTEQTEETQTKGRVDHGRKLDPEGGPIPAQHPLLGVRPRRPVAREGPGLSVERRRKAGGGLGCRPP